MSLDDLDTYPLPPDDRPADQAALDAFSAELGTQLPADYQRFLRTHGAFGIRGGAVFPADDTEGHVSVFYGLGGGADYDVRRNQATYADRLPSSTIPIGEDADYGDQVVLVVTGDGRGSVGTFQHDGPEPEKPEDAITIVAADFTTFVSSLRRDRHEPDPDL
ncbi:MAG: SMI1/KNR4 family protein [Candidatus Dormibacteria bacterium]